MAIVLDDSSSTGIPLPNWVLTIFGVGLILITVWCVAVTAMVILHIYDNMKPLCV